MSYIRFADIQFSTDEVRSHCKTLLRDIRALELQAMRDEEMVEYMKVTVGESTAKVLAGYASLSLRVLYALKVSFWYYSGHYCSQVVHEDDLETVDIFNPLGDSYEP